MDNSLHVSSVSVVCKRTSISAGPSRKAGPSPGTGPERAGPPTDTRRRGIRRLDTVKMTAVGPADEPPVCLVSAQARGRNLPRGRGRGDDAALGSATGEGRRHHSAYVGATSAGVRRRPGRLRRCRVRALEASRRFLTSSSPWRAGTRSSA